MDSGNAERSKKVVGLFLAAALTLAPGCSLTPGDSDRSDNFCTDANQDGYCDEDGRAATGGGRHYSTGFWGFGRSWGWGSSPGSNSGVNSGGNSSSGVSSGSKSGIGSSSRSGGGSSGG